MNGMRQGVLLTLLLTSLGCAVHAADAMPPPRIPDSYAHAGSLVEVSAGRKLNLRCGGEGSPTVLLEAGSHADTTTWFRLQPLLATHYRGDYEALAEITDARAAEWEDGVEAYRALLDAGTDPASIAFATALGRMAAERPSIEILTVADDDPPGT